MSSFVRSSKFRHIFCDPPRVDAQYTNLRLSTVTGEQNYIKANPKYFAIALSVGSILYLNFLTFNASNEVLFLRVAADLSL